MESARQASLMPSIASFICHMTSGLSGFPKFRQSVRAIGRAPLAARLRAASATAILAPALGSRKQYRELQSTVRARPLSVPFILTTAASEPGQTTVSVLTMWSYWRYIQALLAMFGEERSLRRVALRSPGVVRTE